MYRIVHKSVTAGAKENATITTNKTMQRWADPTQLKSDNMIQYNYASFESNSYRPAQPRKLHKSGYLGVLTSELSGADGEFAQPVNIVYEFDKPYSFSGLTIFSRTVLYNIAISYINSDGETVNFSVENQDEVCKIEHTFTNCTQLTISVSNTEPERFLQIWDIEFGNANIFAEENIISVTINKEIDLSTRENPASTLELTVLGAREFKRNDCIDVYKADNLCYNFYVDKISYDVYGEPTTQINCNSYIQQLTSIYYGGIWLKPVNAVTLLDEIFKNTGLSYELEAGLEDETVTGYIPLSTKRDGLLYVAAAIGAVVDDSLKKFRIVKPDYSKPTIEFDASNIVNISKKIETGSENAGVDFTQHIYSTGADATGSLTEEDVKEIYKANVKISETQFIQFSDPIVAFFGLLGLEDADGNIEGKLVAPGVNEDYVSFVSYGANYVSLVVQKLPETAGLTEYNLTLRLLGYAYVDAQNIISKRTTGAVTDEVEKISDMTLISDAGATALNLYNYYQRQNNVTATIIADNIKVNTPVKLLTEIGTVKKITDDLTGILQIEVI